jgi:alpha-L-fucosidase
LLNPLGESDAELQQRMAWFNEARFGMFIHWGAYSVLAGEWQGQPVPKYAEWIRHTAKISKDDYREVCTQFQPDKFDADAWIRTARDAGMKYFVITTKHHDGFCLWDSAYTDYDIKDLAGLDFDPLAELSAACKKYGVRFGTYYSIIDWEYPTTGPGFDKEKYVQFMKDQVRELIEKYDTDILWFDGDWKKWWNLEDGADLYTYIRELKPAVIINNRVSKRSKFKRDFGTPEQATPGMDLGHDWEACWTINHSWGFKKADTKWKSTRELAEKLTDIVSKGGNLLLNVGPQADGSFPGANTEQLLEIGQWLNTTGEAIYGTDSSKIPQPAWGRLTRKGQALFLHVFDWPADGKLVLQGVTKIAPIRASLLGAGGEELSITTIESQVEILLPGQEPAELIPVIRLEFEGEIEAATTTDKLALKDGDIYLSAEQAVIGDRGPFLRGEGIQSLTTWRPRGNRATWEFENVSQDAVYDVELLYTLKPKSTGAEFQLQCGAKEHSFSAPATTGTDASKTLKIREIALPDVGRATLALENTAGDARDFSLRAVILRKR